MKRILFLAALAMAFACNAFANTIAFVNMTNCSYTYHVVYVDPANPTLMRASTAIFVPPMTTISFPTPSSLPPGTALPAIVHYWGVRGWVNVSPTISANVGGSATLGFPLSVQVPSTPCWPQGNWVYFNGNSIGGNVVILIV